MTMHGVSLTYIQAWRAKKKTIKLMREDSAESYAKLPSNLGVIMNSKFF